jgi:hypothetical protein
LIEHHLALYGRPRQWIADVVIGGAATLVAITVAHAALPQQPALSHRPLRPAIDAALVAAPAAEPAVLIRFVEPVPGRAVVSPFGLRKLPWEGGGRLHEGVDIAGQAGEPVLAAADGVVVRSGQDGGYGRFVEVQHAEGLKSFYAHLGAVDPTIAPGVALKAGTALGKLGNTGTSTGPHLHFEIRNADDRPLNPQFFMGRQFAKAEDLPLGSAARVSRVVRIAYVSHIPASKQALMDAKADAKVGMIIAASATAPGVTLVNGRPRARMEMQVPTVASREDRKALVAQIAATQHAQMAAETAAVRPPSITVIERPKAATGTATDAVTQVRVDEVNKPS